MAKIQELCKVRDSVLNDSSKDDVLELKLLLKDQIDPAKFFEESYFTDGINTLLTTAFRRFASKDDHGLIKLTQNMGGGKTHSMVTLGLLAKHKEFRNRFLKPEDMFEDDVRVIGFTGRDTDTKLGIWGELAKQLGKEEEFKEYYSPVYEAPGDEAWKNMLSGAPTVVFIDELPPYLVNAESVQVADSNLAKVTASALSNLFNALNSSELSNVLVVVSDLSGNWSEGSQMIREIFKTIRGEMSRSTLNLAPVSNQSNELVEILKKKLFTTLPSESNITDVAELYRTKLQEAKQMGLTNESPDNLKAQVIQTYPFHPAFIDLYNRFKENEGFQQTRGVIRLVRKTLNDIYKSGAEITLVAPQTLNLANSDICTEIDQLNNSLSAAIRHDVYSDDNPAAAQQIDKEFGGDHTQNVAKLLLVSSLSNVPGGLKGLNESELVAFGVDPNTGADNIKSALKELKNRAWYLTKDKEERDYFHHNKNIVAELNALVGSYDDENARKEAKQHLEKELAPLIKDCYQKVQVFPSADEIDVNSKEVTLIVTEPSALHSGLSDDLTKYWQEHTWKNRFLFLSGEHQTWERLLQIYKERKAINHIIDRLNEDRIPESDPQYKRAKDKQEQIEANITSALRETFVFLHYPIHLPNKSEELTKSEISFQFTGNEFNLEQQITKRLESEKKFTKDIDTPQFRDMVEERLFYEANKEIRWSDLLDNAARKCNWVWHRKDALDALKKKAVDEGYWRENADYVEKGPFAKEPTSVEIIKLPQDYRKDTQEYIVRLIPKYGDVVYIDNSSSVSTSSKKVDNTDFLALTKPVNWFLCVDTKGEHETGQAIEFKTPLVINYDFTEQSGKKYLKLQANCGAEIRYTTDGSPPYDGGVYNDPIPLDNIEFVRVVAKISDDHVSEIYDIKTPGNTPVPQPDPTKPLTYKRNTPTSDTNETIKLLDTLSSYNNSSISVSRLSIKSDDSDAFIDIAISEDIEFKPEQLKKLIEAIRQNNPIKTGVTISLMAKQISFSDGASFTNFADEFNIKLTELQPNDIEQ